MERIESDPESASDATFGPGPERRTGSAPDSAPAAEPSSGSDVDAARQLVLRRLTGSAKTRHQLAEALRDREFDETTIASVLDRMEEVGLVDDAEFARMWVRTRHETKSLGAAALRRELIERGVPEPAIDGALEQVTVEDEESAARELLDRRLGDTVVPAGNGPEERREREKHMRRLVGMLGRRGHSPSTAMRLVREALDERTA